MSYELNLGRPQADPASPFALDAEIKEERAWIGPKPTRATSLLDPPGTTATAGDPDGPAGKVAMVRTAREGGAKPQDGRNRGR